MWDDTARSGTEAVVKAAPQLRCNLRGEAELQAVGAGAQLAVGHVLALQVCVDTRAEAGTMQGRFGILAQGGRRRWGRGANGSNSLSIRCTRAAAASHLGRRVGVTDVEHIGLRQRVLGSLGQRGGGRSGRQQGDEHGSPHFGGPG